ncbi:TetR/AcrR family transcriptional regulator [Halieaceae bacterium IMCC14734]|uniref:TetR/AcrR family transcriptional regulator n=1 Tax=Candidatus Litorirhabdus singularis TaxID=2518993 RepID=A0ABT3TBR0_9GAMM|nr:TetR/AcrR family transcriptional regulator [Candidatus Litorirhabdus singularis]MCX2979731.1 TetR/AcrR family transcriptional regulator [Candidatus Litorirhabdus singularis]
MSEERIARRKSQLGKKCQPKQQRSRQRRTEIMLAAASLLEKVGFDDLTTTLIARELNISVGSLYHYFPHKQAILHAIGEYWLEEYTSTMQEIAEADLEMMTVTQFCQHCVEQLLQVYREQRGVLPLVHAMNAVPELRDLDAHHDELVIALLAPMFARLGISGGQQEHQRRARLWLEMTHALLLSIVLQTPSQARKSQTDLKRLGVTLLSD